MIAAPDPALAASAAALGLIFGSFANVCVHRLPEGISIVTPRSRCPACGALIRWHDNVPVISWIALGARCRSCRARISWTYPLVEAAMGAGFLAAYLVFGLTIEGAAAAWLTFACVTLSVIDLRHFLLPDALTLTGIAAGLLFALGRGLTGASEGGGLAWLGGFFDEPATPLASLGGAAVGAAVPLLARGAYIVMRRLRGEAVAGPSVEAAAVEGEEEDDVAEAALAEGMGLGDVKMLAMVGAFLGARMVLTTILVGSLGGCLIVLPWLLLTRRGWKTPVPFGPFIAAGAVVALFAGESLASAYSGLIRRLIY